VPTAPTELTLKEVELKFGVPPEKRSALLKALRGGDFCSQRMLEIYYDTSDGKLASHGVSLCLRKEGPDWIQTTKAETQDPLRRLEHNVRLVSPGVSPGRAGIPTLSLERHRGASIFPLIAQALQPIEREDLRGALIERFRIDVLRRTRTAYSGDSRIELVFDTGTIRHADQTLLVCELELQLKAGAIADLFALAELWATRTGLWISSASKSSRGENLIHDRINGVAVTAVTRKIHGREGKLHFLRLTLQNCLQQIIGNMSEIAAGATDQQFSHQLRIGLRRIRIALCELNNFGVNINRTWEPIFAEAFQTLGQDRDDEMIMPTILHDMHLAGINYAWTVAEIPKERTARAVVTAVPFQRAVLEILSYCDIALAAAQHQKYSHKALKQKLSRILDKLHKQLSMQIQQFPELSATRQHQVRKRIKRLRYLSEFVASMFGRRQVSQYLKPWCKAQDALGKGNDYRVGMQAILADSVSAQSKAAALDWLDSHIQNSVTESSLALRKALKKPAFW